MIKYGSFIRKQPQLPDTKILSVSITGSGDEGKRHTGAVLSGSLRGSFKIHRELSMTLEKAFGWENRHL